MVLFKDTQIRVFSTVVKVANYFDVPLDYFIDGDNHIQTDIKLILSQEEEELIRAYRSKSDDAKDVIAASLGVKRQDTGLRSSNKAEETA